MSGAPGEAAVEQTDVGSYFIANYPPFSTWRPEAVAADARPALVQSPRDVPLGLYLHIPFCRKRCHFCYFRVYTDKNAREVEQYLDLLAREWVLYAETAAVRGRGFDFVYFGGGTPSFLSTKQLQGLVRRLNANGEWNHASEITFECEPGTLSDAKLSAIRELGVTRLSLGVENFDDRILEVNGRAHRSPEVTRAYASARALGFPQVNIDLIAGMLGETDANWRACVERTLALQPDSVTIYQMELPYNTTISGDLLKGGSQFSQVADWATKRRWVAEAFEALERAGYHVGSAYTAVQDPSRTKFVYRDRLWEGADLLGLGVASFGHVNGVHMQNLDKWPAYAEAIDRGDVPLGRAYTPTNEERMIREFVLQLKRGANRPAYFREKYGVDVLTRFAGALNSLREDGYLSEATADRIALTRDGLMRVDVLLPRFFLPQHAGIRYT
ncbi:MAG TPA: coproporphyrinogen-III oxidase family protein [Vicinamibacterales bacterium]|nr:coproporphyrinogen-III oxidase family protein [Vicinamibacterales bacterium]